MAYVAAIVGSAFEHPGDLGLAWETVAVDTGMGSFEVLRIHERGQTSYVVFRHGFPHRWLPHQIPYRAMMSALKSLGVSSLLVTSSVGVLDHELPLFKPMLVGDLITVDNRLADGSACSNWPEPHPSQGHLVLEHGLFDAELGQQVVALSGTAGMLSVIFGYAPGPRTKTRAENRLWKQWGAQVNSMTLAPEVILANELGIATAAVVVGHKYSLAESSAPDPLGIRSSLEAAREQTRGLVKTFLCNGNPVAFKNHLYRFES